MNCLKEAEYKLRDYAAKKNALAATADQIAMLEAESTCIRSATTDSTPVQGGGNCREDAMLDNIAKRAELKAAHDSTAEWLRIVDTALPVGGEGATMLGVIMVLIAAVDVLICYCLCRMAKDDKGLPFDRFPCDEESDEESEDGWDD